MDREAVQECAPRGGCGRHGPGLVGGDRAGAQPMERAAALRAAAGAVPDSSDGRERREPESSLPGTSTGRLRRWGFSHLPDPPSSSPGVSSIAERNSPCRAPLGAAPCPRGAPGRSLPPCRDVSPNRGGAAARAWGVRVPAASGGGAGGRAAHLEPHPRRPGATRRHLPADVRVEEHARRQFAIHQQLQQHGAHGGRERASRPLQVPQSIRRGGEHHRFAPASSTCAAGMDSPCNSIFLRLQDGGNGVGPARGGGRVRRGRQDHEGTGERGRRCPSGPPGQGRAGRARPVILGRGRRRREARRDTGHAPAIRHGAERRNAAEGGSRESREVPVARVVSGEAVRRQLSGIKQLIVAGGWFRLGALSPDAGVGARE